MIKRWRRLILITGVWGSWKTTLQNELISKYGWQRPVNFTTRNPRSWDIHSTDEDGDYNGKERDEYVFLNREQFISKFKNWDFLEMTNPADWIYYWVSRFLPDENVAIVVDPVWRSQIMQYFINRWFSIEAYFIECSAKLQEERLIWRWDSEKSIISKKRDLEWFSPTYKCVRLSGKKSPSELADVIQNRWNGK